MSRNARETSREELLQENNLLRDEVRVARRASDITAQLVAEQFARIEKILLRLEDKAKAEQNLRRELAEKLREAVLREEELARDRKRLEDMQIAAVNMMEDIAAAREVAEAAAAAKGEFLANMSHEIRTPMTAVLGFAEVVRDEMRCCDTCPNHRGCEIRKRNEQYLGTICKNGAHLLDIINSILDLSKVEMGRMDVERVRFSLLAVVEDVASLMGIRAEDKGLPFTVEYPGTLPETVESDPTKLRQILVNLIGNAVKFTDDGGIRLVVRFLDASADASVGPTEPVIEFQVIDTGIGMTEAQMQCLFQPFSQADSSTTRRYGGTGLGLAISKRLAHLLHGDITVKSRPGAGSTFTALIAAGPLDGVRFVAHTTTPAAQATDQDAAAPNLTFPARILLAEDGPDNQRLISFMLSKAGAQVTVAGNGQEAVEIALDAWQGDRPFDVILMDMQMPVLDGYGATRRLRDKGYTGPIVALTAHAMAGDQKKCIECGCDAYAAKPIDRHELIRLIADQMRRADDDAATVQPKPGALVVELDHDPDMIELIDLFVAGLSRRLQAIENALDELDLDALAELTHQLKGAAGSYGFPAITDAAGALEHTARTQQDLDQLKEQIQTLAALCTQAEASSTKPS